jgi:hypothetical protein
VSRSLTRRARRALGALAFAAAFVSLAASSSFAATLQHQTGVIGHTHFKDRESKPGATCLYEGAAGTQYFIGMRFKSMAVEYRDESSAVEHGKVGQKVVLQHWAGSGPWQNYVTSTETKITAYNNAFFTFPVRTQNWNGATAMGGKWRAEVILTWYNADNSVKGRGYWTLDWYECDYNDTRGTSCKGKWSALG